VRGFGAAPSEEGVAVKPLARGPGLLPPRRRRPGEPLDGVVRVVEIPRDLDRVDDPGDSACEPALGGLLARLRGARPWRAYPGHPPWGPLRGGAVAAGPGGPP